MNLDQVWDVLFPKICVGCGVEGDWLCRGCIGSITVIYSPYCPECRLESAGGRLCDGCRDQWCFDGVMICAEYEGVMKELIHSFKYEGLADAASILGQLSSACLKSRQDTLGIDDGWMVLPIPMTSEKELERGYNQTDLLAGVVAKNSGLSLYDKGLLKTRQTIPQMMLTRSQRLTNVEGSFAWDGEDLLGQNIVLIDDVTTTGATLSECAKILKKSGAGQVWGLVLAKGN